MRRRYFTRKHLPAAGLAILAALLVAHHYGVAPSKKQAAVINPGFYTVAYFDDGDTIVVNTPSGKETVRFIGVDTPETHDPRKPVQCFGPEASAYTKSLIGDQKVKLVADPLDTDRDRYGRLLRYIYLPDGTLVNEKLIQTGHGFYYPYFPFSKKAKFAKAERQAISNNLGLWAKCDPIPTDQGGYTSPPLASVKS